MTKDTGREQRAREVQEQQEQINQELDNMDWEQVQPEMLSKLLFLGRQQETAAQSYIKGEDETED